MSYLVLIVLFLAPLWGICQNHNNEIIDPIEVAPFYIPSKANNTHLPDSVCYNCKGYAGITVSISTEGKINGYRVNAIKVHQRSKLILNKREQPNSKNELHLPKLYQTFLDKYVSGLRANRTIGVKARPVRWMFILRFK
jgi:hypothetical protein